MSENKVKWHKYPDEKPKCESGYVVIFDNNGYLEAKYCPWIKGMFTGIKNTLVKAWTEMPYVIGGQGIMSENKVKWNPYPQEKPKREGDYLLTLMIDNHRYIRFGYYCIFKKRSCFLGTNEMYILAWAELPEPYEG